MVEQYPVSNEISGARRILFDTESDPRHDYSASQDPHRSTASRPQSTSPITSVRLKSEQFQLVGYLRVVASVFVSGKCLIYGYSLEKGNREDL